jgi:hypothetical protein
LGEPSIFGTQPWSNWRARAEAIVTNSNEFGGRVVGRVVSVMTVGRSLPDV